MKLHSYFFWAASFFLTGVLIASIFSSWLVSFWPAFLLTIFICLLFLFLGKKILALLAIFMVLGSAYYFLYDFYQKDEILEFGKKVDVIGVIREVKTGLSSQKIRIGEIQITAQRYPAFEYGDEVEVEGTIKEIPEEQRGYFSKEGIFGLMSFPKITLLSKNKSSFIKSGLLKINFFIQESFKKVMPQEKAAFLAGLTLGETSEFNKGLEERLRLTGTTHLVALSGYNITIIAKTAALLFGVWLSRRFSFALIILLIAGFVVMTGAEASAVRAAIMAFILLLADQINRQYYLRNAIILTALAMVAINPKILAFDLGFQLSFLAVLGIIYLRPWLQKIFKFSDQPGFLGWRANFLTTTAAQLAVLPLLLLNFGYFSPIALLTNVLILEFIPLTMALGFFTAGAALISYPLSLVIGWITQLFLAYILGIIGLCSKITNIFI